MHVPKQRKSCLNGCTRKPKVKHPSEEEAKKQVAQIKASCGKDVVSYKCLYCDGWHVGKQRQKSQVVAGIDASLAQLG